MADSLNAYGDLFRPTNDGHGVDIASQRQDELDIGSVALVRELVSSGRHVQALDLGGGFGAHSIRLANAGASVTLVDIADMATAHFVKAVQDGLARPGQLRFVQKDFSELSPGDIPEGIHVFYSQRAIHYVTYAKAKQALGVIFNRVYSGGVAFVSAAGYDTEYGKTYPDREKTVEDRFTFVTPEMQQKHGITHKIVTYKEEDLVNLLRDVGFSEVKVTRSTFGNIKAVARKP